MGLRPPSRPGRSHRDCQHSGPRGNLTGWDTSYRQSPLVCSCGLGAGATLSETGLGARAYRVLGRLRYQGPPYRLSAGQLAEGMGLSSGAMTNRLDRLEDAGLVRRLPDPDDRRGVLVEPTEAGHAAWDRAVSTQAGREALIASVLSEDEREQLHALMRRLMGAFPEEVCEAAKRGKARAQVEDD